MPERKAGLLVGHTEAIVTGVLAGYNAVLYCEGERTSCTAGKHTDRRCHRLCKKGNGDRGRTFPQIYLLGSVYFERMKEIGRYSTDTQEIRSWVEKAGMLGVFDQNNTEIRFPKTI